MTTKGTPPTQPDEPDTFETFKNCGKRQWFFGGGISDEEGCPRWILACTNFGVPEAVFQRSYTDIDK